MCGRFAMKAFIKKLINLLNIQKLYLTSPYNPRYNIAPTQNILTIQNLNNHRSLTEKHWGLIPNWAKDKSFASKMINARSESLHEKPSFKEAFKKRRCIIPASGYYEWKKISHKSQPYYITTQDEIIWMAGLWDEWKNPKNGKVIQSCTIITTEANDILQTIHHRMPVILNETSLDLWLDSSVQEMDFFSNFFKPYSNKCIQIQEVKPIVNNPQNDGPECIESVSWF